MTPHDGVDQMNDTKLGVKKKTLTEGMTADIDAQYSFKLKVCIHFYKTHDTNEINNDDYDTSLSSDLQLEADNG